MEHIIHIRHRDVKIYVLRDISLLTDWMDEIVAQPPPERIEDPFVTAAKLRVGVAASLVQHLDVQDDLSCPWAVLPNHVVLPLQLRTTAQLITWNHLAWRFAPVRGAYATLPRQLATGGTEA
jgi:hypothetical protein